MNQIFKILEIVSIRWNCIAIDIRHSFWCFHLFHLANISFANGKCFGPTLSVNWTNIPKKEWAVYNSTDSELIWIFHFNWFDWNELAEAKILLEIKWVDYFVWDAFQFRLNGIKSHTYKHTHRGTQREREEKETKRHIGICIVGSVVE